MGAWKWLKRKVLTVDSFMRQEEICLQAWKHEADRLSAKLQDAKKERDTARKTAQDRMQESLQMKAELAESKALSGRRLKAYEEQMRKAGGLEIDLTQERERREKAEEELRDSLGEMLAYPQDAHVRERAKRLAGDGKGVLPPWCARCNDHHTAVSVGGKCPAIEEAP